jgi:hypothetical protein
LKPRATPKFLLRCQLDYQKLAAFENKAWWDFYKRAFSP